MQKKILFAIEDYHYFVQELNSLGDIEIGEIEKKTFQDGEIYHRILTNVTNRKVVLVGGTISDKHTLELYDMAQGIIHAGAHSLEIVIPYFGYATMEREVLSGEIVKAKNRALLFSSLPMCAETNKIYLMDLHTEGLPYYFDRDIRCKHLYCKQVIMDIARSAGGYDFVLASTDAGRAKWVESLANDLQVRSAFVYKQRLSGTETVVTGVNADVKDKKVIIYDDMIRTGGSLRQAAEVYKHAGANEIIAIATHGLFNDHALDKIAAQGIIKNVYVTNTHPNALAQQNSLLKVSSVASIIFDALK